jgi:hypothetical protein
MDSLGPESRNLHALLSSEIKQIMKQASVVPVFKGGVLQSHLLQKAWYVYLSVYYDGSS